MPQTTNSCGIRVFIFEWFSILFMFIQQRLHNSFCSVSIPAFR